MINKTYIVTNFDEIEYAEKIGIIPPDEIKTWDTFWFDINDVKYAYKTHKGNINLEFDDGRFTVPYDNEIINALNKKFK